MKRLILLSVLAIFTLSCSQERLPKDVLPEQQFKAVLKDIHLAEAYLNTIPGEDSIKKVAPGYYAVIFKKHHIDFQQFDRSMRYYAKHPVLLDTIYSQLNAELEQSRTQRHKKGNKQVEEIPKE